ncbi:hypothetical protein Zmor_008002 [Zophobas morio]|uniref:RNA helicase n=1 Tax=Zophobas morio TaxID=2755281 RepID=A0AA38IWV0_9CUCU|nr:hypothetical protein Zmor_008002 [Zophobas morio]
MWRSFFSLFWRHTGVPIQPLSLDEAYNVIRECKQEVPNGHKKEEHREVEDIGQYEVLSKIGRVTHADGNTFRVDDLYDFQTDISDLIVGSKISYQLIRSEGGVKVCDVRLIENDWNVVDTGKKKWHERTLICSVVQREGRIISLSPGNITINLNSVCSEFIPIAGDWVELDVKCEIDENVVDLNGKIIEINKVQPLRPQVKLGQVSQWNSQESTGVVNKNIFFDKDALYCGYQPVRGDKVVAEIIESNQDQCTWRALKIVPDYLHLKENKAVKVFKEEELQDTHDLVNITDNIFLIFGKVGETKLFLVEVQAKAEDVKLICVQLPKLNGQCRLSDNIDHFTIKAHNTLTVRLECVARNVGDSRELVIFHFERFKLKRWVSVHVLPHQGNNGKVRPGFAPKQYVPRTRREVIKGQKLHYSARFVPLCMPDFSVPERLLNLITHHQYPSTNNFLKTELERSKPCLVTALNYMNFEDKFHTLLHLDEIHMMIEMQNYDQERACFIKNGEYLLLEIENLAERRPSVISGDRVIARSLTDPTSPDYEGVIHKTGKNHAFIKFSQIFHDAYDGEDYSVYLVASRTTYRREHFAVNLAIKNLGKDWLFPTKIVEQDPQVEFVFDNYVDSLTDLDLVEAQPPRNVIGKQSLLEKIQRFNENGVENLPVRKLEWYNRCLNFYQKEAVRNILLGVCRPLPYIIFGPPGTGKTVTIVETVLQILRLMPHSRVLLSAPSNSAADLLALRLIDSGVLKPGDLIRLVALSAVSNVAARLAPFTATANIEREGTESSSPVVMPNGLVLGYNSSVLGRHRITVCTCSSAGLLYSMGFSKGHFSHIIVDEAGQTSEPSVLIPLAFLDTSNGQAVLAGDPMQLGPVIMSHLASDYGLEESFLERMTSRFPYIRDSQGFPNTCGYDPRLITKLIYNYRSLPDLLKLPSVLFYNDDLKPTISETDSKEASILQQVQEILPRTPEGKVASVVFHGVFGENFQAEDSPSWFNPSEASQVFFYVNELYRLGLKATDVGIITPYKAQTRQLMDLFKEAEFEVPKVGTVEEFQGQEFNVIILSTVRSAKKHLSSDIKYSLGFVASPRRMNVSITRAKSLLIVVGNPDLLSSDRSWRSIITYCMDKGGLVGGVFKEK